MTTTVAELAIPTGTWMIDPDHSRAGFRVKHFGIAWLRGAFPTAFIAIESSADGQLSLRGSAAVTDIDLKNDQLKGHLASPEFFDAQLHPKITFSSSDISIADDGSVTAQGELTIKGKSNPVQLSGQLRGPIEDMAGSQRLGLELRGEIDRFDYDVSWAAQVAGNIDVVGRKVILEGEFEMVQQ